MGTIRRIDGLRFEVKRLATGWYTFRLKIALGGERDFRFKPLGPYENEAEADAAAFKAWSPKVAS